MENSEKKIPFIVPIRTKTATAARAPEIQIKKGSGGLSLLVWFSIV